MAGDGIDSRTGHRKRLREKFLRAGDEAFLDYEILELLLSYAIGRRDVKPMAKRLIEKYKTLEGVVDADIADLTAIPEIGESSAILIKLIRSMMVRYLGQRLRNEDYMDDSDKFCDYARARLGDQTGEAMMLFYLNTKNVLIDTEIVNEGAVDCVVVFPSIVAKRALLRSAKAVVLCHNHPSGIVKPSREDDLVTREVRAALESLKITLLDHIIVSKYDYYSYRYEDSRRPSAFRFLAPLSGREEYRS
ncbi:MAG: DNA repair protein RadC [Lentisphaeria bacterium]|nr:DNA repair protein RadC [Lentisphaeria bacterium]